MNVECGKLLDRSIGTACLAVLAGLRWVFGGRRDDGVREPVRSILLVKLWGIGNLALILPLLERLKAAHPSAEIHFLTLESNRALVESSPHVSRVFGLRLTSLAAFARDALRAVLRLRRLKPDLVLDFEQFCRISAILTFLTGARKSVGLETAGRSRAWLYTRRVPYDNTRHMSLTFMDVAIQGGVSGSAYEPSLPADPPSARDEVENILPPSAAADRLLIAMHPGSGDNFIARRWPAERFAGVALALIERHGALIVLTGSAGERDMVEEVKRRLPRDAVVDATGRLSLPGLVALIRRTDLLVSNDTGPVHIASATGTPVFALFGPNTPDLYGPLHADGHAFYRRLPCSPCITNLNAKSSRCGFAACIRAIKEEEVLFAIERLLASERAGAPALSESF